jgi:hypothetical protein
MTPAITSNELRLSFAGGCHANSAVASPDADGVGTTSAADSSFSRFAMGRGS